MRIEVVPLPGPGRAAKLRCTSSLDRVEWLAKPRIFLESGPDGDYLEFESPVKYRGIQMKRGPYREDELIAVGKGESVESRPVDLAELYALPAYGEVRVRYVGRQPLAGLDAAGGPFQVVESSWVTLPES